MGEESATRREYLAEPSLVDAMLDRLVHNSNRIELSGEWLREKSAEKGSEKIVNANPQRVATDG